MDALRQRLFDALLTEVQVRYGTVTVELTIRQGQVVDWEITARKPKMSLDDVRASQKSVLD